MRLQRRGDAREFEVEVVARDANTLRVRVDGVEIAAEVAPAGAGGAILTIGGRRIAVYAAKRRDSVFVAAGPASFEFVPAEAARRRRHGLAAREIAAPMPGKVLKVMVAAGDRVAAGQPLVVIEAMKMETTLAAEDDALVARVRVAEGDMIDHGAVLIELSPADSSARGSSAPES